MLQLKKLSAEDARAKSKALIGEASHSLLDKKIGIALKKYVIGKLTQLNVEDAPKSMIQKDLDYISTIC